MVNQKPMKTKPLFLFCGRQKKRTDHHQAYQHDIGRLPVKEEKRKG
jgi:hypothetical protein